MAAGKDESPESAVNIVKAEVESVEVTDAEANGAVAERSPEVEPQLTDSFKEESNFVSDLKDHEKKALQDLKVRVEEAILKNEFALPENEKKEKENGETDKTEKSENEKPADKETVKIVETATESVVKGGNVEVKAEETSVTITEQVSDEKVAVEEVPTPEESHAAESSAVATTEVSAPTAENVEPKAEAAAPAEPTSADVKIPGEALEAETEKHDSKHKDIDLWGVPLLHTRGDQRTDVILLKFLRARDFKVQEAFDMLKNTILWRKSFKTDSILQEDFGNELDGVAYMNGCDKEGHPVCYNVYGVFQDKELYQKAFGSEEKRERFLRWRVQLLEKGIKQLSFTPGAMNSMVQITDLKNSPGPGKKELRLATNKALHLLQDNYPEFVARKIFINVPWWYVALSAMISPFVTQRTKSKFVIARSSKVPETLFKYISPENVPVQYGGLKRDNDQEFSGAEGGVSELIVKAGAKEVVEILATEVGTTVVWDLTVVGWEVNYKEEFVPTAEGCYTVIIQKENKMAPHEEPVRNSFRIGEPGKIVLTINNTSSRKKKLVYRSQVKKSDSV